MASCTPPALGETTIGREETEIWLVPSRSAIRVPEITSMRELVDAKLRPPAKFHRPGVERPLDRDRDAAPRSPPEVPEVGPEPGRPVAVDADGTPTHVARR